MSKQSLLEHYQNSPDSLERYIEDLYEIDVMGKVTDVPYWWEEYCRTDIEYKVQYVPGYHEPYKYGDIIEIDSVKYKYIDSIALPEELEIQEDDGSLGYIYIGYHFLRVLQPIKQEEA